MVGLGEGEGKVALEKKALRKTVFWARFVSVLTTEMLQYFQSKVSEGMEVLQNKESAQDVTCDT